ncbi:hypothetical protein BGZ79_000294 [Entomortierella chlamydospora]|nr:hypothetical protein BGZ79_000294 [Entomortierella chlamydospora]
MVQTKDAEFIELNKKFTTCEKVTASLLTEVCKYRDNITTMLNSQAEFGIILAEIYDPSLGMPPGEVTPRRTQTAPESMQAVNDFQAVMRETRDILLPEIDKLEFQVVQPLTDMQTNMKLIRKTITKRDHKLIDYDRYRISLQKLRDKKEKTLSDERQIYKLESQLEVATSDYEGLNSLLKEELPGFFYYKTHLMEPIFHIFYYLQLRIYRIMLDRMGPISGSGYFDLSMDVQQGYEARKQDTLATVESVEHITKRSAAASYTSKYSRQATQAGGSASPDPSALSASPAPSSPKPWQASAVPGAAPAAKPWQTGAGVKPWQTGGAGAVATSNPWQTGTTYSANQETPGMPPPPSYNTVQRGGGSEGSQPAAAPAANSGFRMPQNIDIHVTPSISGTIAATATAAATSHAINAINDGMIKKGPPPPPPKKIGVRMVVALYDYDAQQEGDLSFRRDDRIELIERTPDVNGWWSGRLNGRQGLFPGNYVQEL